MGVFTVAGTVRLIKALERTVAHGHPWIYRDALATHAIPPGQLVDVLDRNGRFLARGLSDSGAISVRVLLLQRNDCSDELFHRRIEDALALRDGLPLGNTNAMRLIHGEGDQLPGLVCDRYGEFAVLSLDGNVWVEYGAHLIEWLAEPLRKRGIRGLLIKYGRGPERKVQCLWGNQPPQELEVLEHGMKLIVNLWHGQKTGLFLDHRKSRLLTRRYANAGEVLNLYGYTGGFSVSAGLGEAKHVVTVDRADAAIELADKTWQANGLDPDRHLGMAQDTEQFFRENSGCSFDFIISDPPSFAPNARSLNNALRAYQAVHCAAIHALRPNGLYLAASCSSHVTREAFESTLRQAAHNTRNELQVINRWGADADHPIPLGFPEGEYLKAILCRKYGAKGNSK